jgi:hypothetical protein
VSAAFGPRLLAGLGAVGFAFGLWILLGLGIHDAGGTAGTDALAYWRAGRAVLDGTELYGLRPGATSAYLYTPLFAQFVAPASILPPVAFVWLWRLLEVACLRLVVGSWSRAGLAILVFPPVLIELAFGNVNLVVAAVCALAMRGAAAATSLPIVVKLTGLPLVPLALVADRKGFLVGLAVAALVVAGSVLAAPHLWAGFLAFLGQVPEPAWWTNLSRGTPLVLRLAIAMALGVVAIRWRRLAPVAVIVGLPIIWVTSLSILVAVAAPLPARARALPAGELAR